jgi:predicted  nucleic acid-binding Zn-ribbon protein
MPITEDERFSSRLESELHAAHERIAEDNKEMNALRGQLATAQAFAERYRPLAESAVDLRTKLHAADRESERLRAKQPDLQARIRGLEDELAEREAKIVRLEASLARYDAVNERVQESSHVLDLFEG